MKKSILSWCFGLLFAVVGVLLATDMKVQAKDYFYRTDDYLEEYEGDSSVVTIPDDVRIICELSFYKCDTITSVIVPDSVTTIRSNAFYKCPNLVHAEIPPSVKKIGKNAFRECGENLVIDCEKDSVAHAFAVERGFAYRFVDFDSRMKKQKITVYDRTVDYDTKTFDLEAKASGGGKLTYKVSDKKVLTVSKTGKVTVKACGRTKVIIKAAAKGKYLAATKTITLTVRPNRQKIASIESGGPGKMTVTWKKDKKASGYILEYSRDPGFDVNLKGNVKTVLISSKNRTSHKISGLKKGKKYYVRIRSYKTAGNSKVKGRWSKVKSVKVKK